MAKTNNDDLLNKIHLGDCLEIMDSIIDGSIHLILCDLPYGTTQNKWDSIIDIDALWSHYKRVLHPLGTIVLTAAQPFTSILVSSNLKMFKYEWIWKKTGSTNFLNAKHQPLRIHESVLVFYNKNVYNPQGLKAFNLFRKDKPGINTDNYGEVKGEQYLQKFTNYPESVITFSSEINTIHSTQKPVPLFRYLIRTYSNIGDIVLDNCIGSGTTAIACIEEGRNFIGIEKWDKMHKKANNRLANHVKVESTKLFTPQQLQPQQITLL